MDKRQRMINDDVEKSIISLTIPMIFGIIGLVVFNLVDTYFVSRLGTKQLAALTFTFPVVLVVNSIALGLSVGASSCVSRALGRKDMESVKRLATDSLTLSLLIVMIFVILGMLTVDPLFRAMGAGDEILEYIKSYMYIWYPGMIFVLFPMVGNGCIRALGDTFTPGMIMVIAGIGNVVMDPVFIFGFSSVPAMGIKGAAIATVISRGVTFAVSMYVLVFRERIISFQHVTMKDLFESWREILFVGVPNIFTRIAIPLASGVITKIMSRYGISVVAGYGIALKVEFLALILVNAVSAVMTPFAGQNYGSYKLSRIKESLRFTTRVSFLWGAFILFVLNIYSGRIASLFNPDQAVVAAASSYMNLVSLAYGFQGAVLIYGSVLNGINRPLQSAFISIFQMFFVYIPASFYLSRFFGYGGVFAALASSHLITFIIASIIVKNILKEEEERLGENGS